MNLRDFLRYALIGGVFLVPLIPFVTWSSMFFPFITSKGFAFRVLAELLLGLWVVLALLDVRYRPRFSWIVAAVTSFVAVILVADLGSVNVFKSLWSNFERMEGWVTLAHLFAYFLVVSTVLNTEKLWARFAGTSVGASALMCVYGITQLAGYIQIQQGGDRLDGAFGNATYLAIYLLVHIFITTLLLVRWRGEAWARWVFAGVIALQVFALFQTETRGAILGLVAGLFVMGLLFLFTVHEHPRLKNVGIGALVGLVILVGAFFIFKDAPFIKHIRGVNRIAAISLSDPTVNARFLVWDMAWQGFKERPLLGWGQESFNYVFNKYYLPEMYDQEPWFDRAHNVFFDWLIAGGALGLLAYLSMPLAFLYYLWFGRRRDGSAAFSGIERSVFTGLLAAYGFHNMFVFDQIGSYLFFFSLLAYGHWRVSPPTPELRFLQKDIPLSFVKTIIAPLCFVVVAVVFYAVNVPGIRTNVGLLQAVQPKEVGITNNIETFQRVASYNAFGQQEVAEQLVQFAMGVSRVDRLPLEDRVAVVELAETTMKREIERAPEDARLLVFLGSFLSNMGRPRDAQAYLERAVQLSPNKQMMRFALGAALLKEGRFEEALVQYRTALELAPDNNEARLRYAAAALYAGHEDTTRQLLLEKFGTVIVDDDFLLQAYIDAGHDQEVIDIWRLRVVGRPNDPQTILSLGAAYYRAGQYQNAITQITKVVNLSDQFKAQGESLIRQIKQEAGLPL